MSLPPGAALRGRPALGSQARRTTSPGRAEGCLRAKRRGQTARTDQLHLIFCPHHPHHCLFFFLILLFYIYIRKIFFPKQVSRYKMASHPVQYQGIFVHTLISRHRHKQRNDRRPSGMGPLRQNQADAGAQPPPSLYTCRAGGLPGVTPGHTLGVFWVPGRGILPGSTCQVVVWGHYAHVHAP